MSSEKQPFQETSTNQEEIDKFLSSKSSLIRKNPFIVDFFETMKKNLGDYPFDHPSRIEFNANLVKIFDELIRVLSLFAYDPTGALVPTVEGLITGTTYNDFYKLTMASVIAWAESVMSGPVNVCFGTDIRENSLAQKLLENHNGIRVDVITALNGLAGRRFNLDIVKQAVSGKSIQRFWEQNSERIFGPPESPNTLIRPHRPEGANPSDFHGDTLIYNRPLTPADVADGGVAITVYVGSNANPTQPPMKVYIEAMGPWGKSTFLDF